MAAAHHPLAHCRSISQARSRDGAESDARGFPRDRDHRAGARRLRPTGFLGCRVAAACLPGRAAAVEAPGGCQALPDFRLPGGQAVAGGKSRAKPLSEPGAGLYRQTSAFEPAQEGSRAPRKESLTACLCCRMVDDTLRAEMPSTADNGKAPKVPNHAMVRSIGRGSYGEIWLARSLTGTWRAVKIVDRRGLAGAPEFH